MKKSLVYFLIGVFAFSLYGVRPALAQAGTPPAGPVGEIRGTVTNQNSGKVVTESLEVMLHALDMYYADKDTQHGQSRPDGTFGFARVPFDANTQFAVMAIYDGVTYFSEPMPADMKSMQVAIDVPVYESTTDLMNIQVDQMHVLFGFSEDGLETKELYIVSNTGERTVKDVYDLGNDQFAALQFPLPGDADYVFFKPDNQDRFVKRSGSFADTYPVLPGNQPSQIMVSYLVPYSGERIYTYTAPVNIARINFLLPEHADVSLKGSALFGPESMTLQDGASYRVYSYSDLNAGQTLRVSLAGTARNTKTNTNTNNLLIIGTAFLGLVIIGVGVWWWRRPETTEEDEINDRSDKPTLDELIVEIARLDEIHEQEGLSSEAYRRQREALMQRAKRLL